MPGIPRVYELELPLAVDNVVSVLSSVSSFGVEGLRVRAALQCAGFGRAPQDGKHCYCQSGLIR